MNHKGFSLIELVLVFGIAMILSVGVVMFANPVEYRAKTRDGRRLTDVSTLDRIINEYFVDTGSYPDSSDVLRLSTSLPFGQVGPVENIISGWITVDLSPYNSKLPVDPLNDATYFYSYQHTEDTYEINASLEHQVEYMQEDGGNDNGIYEIGNDLTIL